jgi:hypothetical protein
MSTLHAAALRSAVSGTTQLEVVADLEITSDLLTHVKRFGAHIIIVPVRTSRSLAFCRDAVAQWPLGKVVLLNRTTNSNGLDLYEFSCFARDINETTLVEKISALASTIRTPFDAS